MDDYGKQSGEDARAIAITRGVVAFILLINLILQAFGWTPLDVEYESVYTIVSGVLAILATIWAWWKNNNITKAAQQAQKILTATKEDQSKQ